MIYAYLTDGLDLEQRDEFDRVLEDGSKVGQKKQAARERDAVAAAMRFAGG